jgi:hypothetical protein
MKCIIEGPDRGQARPNPVSIEQMKSDKLPTTWREDKMRQLITGLAILVLSLTTGILANGETIVNLVNGDFEDPSIFPDQWAFRSWIPGWAAAYGEIEIQSGPGQYTGGAFSGSQFIELDAGYNSSIFQDVYTQRGKQYTLSFYYAPRNSFSGMRFLSNTTRIDVFWENQFVASVAADGPWIEYVNQWNQYSFPVTANNPNNISRLQFNGAGISDSVGGLLDKVELTEIIVPDPSVIGLSDVLSTTVIKGATGSLGVTIANTAAPGANNLNYSISAYALTGVATLGGVQPGAGSLAPGASATNTVTATSANLGPNTIRFTATAPQAGNSPQTIDATLTVLDHSAAAFADGSNVLDLDFGTIGIDAGTQSLQYGIQNLSAPYRAGLDLDDVLEVLDPAGAFSTNATSFSNLAPGATSDLFHIYFEPLSVGRFDGRYRFTLSDQDGISGSTGGQVLTLNVTANVVPEPSALALVGASALGLVAYAWRRRLSRRLWHGGREAISLPVHIIP